MKKINNTITLSLRTQQVKIWFERICFNRHRKKLKISLKKSEPKGSFLRILGPYPRLSLPPSPSSCRLTLNTASSPLHALILLHLPRHPKTPRKNPISINPYNPLSLSFYLSIYLSLSFFAPTGSGFWSFLSFVAWIRNWFEKFVSIDSRKG